MSTSAAAAVEEELLNDDSHEFLTFALGEEEYGIPILNVQEIIGYQKPTPVPNQPAWVSGVVNIRGNVIPVVDTRRVFSMEKRDYDALSVIIVTHLAGRTIGYAVDQVNDVLAFSDEQMQTPPEVTEDVRVDCISGLGKMENRLVMLLDMEQVLDGAQVNPV